MVVRRITAGERQVLLGSLKRELEEWWTGHPEMRSYAMIGRRAGVSEVTVRRLFQGTQLPSPDTARMLADFIESPTLRICAETRFHRKGSSQAKHGRAAGGTPRQRATVRSDARDRIARIESMLLGLAEEIEFFKKGTPAERELFKAMLDPTDIGYITSLLRAFFDEDAFQQWILLSRYEMKGGRS